MYINPRFQAISQIQQRAGMAPVDQSRRPSEIFGEHVFGPQAQKQYLSRQIFQQLEACVAAKRFLDESLAEPVANAVKAWALDHGATHYTHWFQPLTGRTAEKHDSFLELSEGEALDKFSAFELFQQEPDASSFPSGGLRHTFEARGYTAWDSSSPIFIFDTTYGTTLCIPTVFVSYTGKALDHKTPLLRSIALLDKAATSVAQYFDKTVKRVSPMLGAEQEYFLIDRAFWDLRPDLILTGRTLLGAAPPRGQQLDDHYFGAIPERVFGFMNELERACHKLGIPMRTRHNEVAPSQFECAPQFGPQNVALDQQLMIMDLIDRVARKHHFTALLHEKPFAGINGSGKHNNWSLQTDTGKNLLSPGPDPEGNLMFLTFFACVICGVYRHAGLLQASIASPGNDLRLGQNEAPPNVLSVFVGRMLDKVLNDIEKPPRRKRNEQVSELMHLGITEIPEILTDNTDRNRTSPFAFTGNKFEFRAVGAAANSSFPMMVLNVVVAQQLQELKDRVDSKMRRGRKLEAALLDMIREYLGESNAIRFEGDGYSKAWLEKAKSRGLKVVRHTPDGLRALLTPQTKQLFKEANVLSETELEARYNVLMTHYISRIQIEAKTLTELAQTTIYPEILSHQNALLQNWHSWQLLPEELRTGNPVPLESFTSLHRTFVDALEKVKSLQAEGEGIEKSTEKAYHYAERVRPALFALRKNIDLLEGELPDAKWPLPKYREMLFIR